MSDGIDWTTTDGCARCNEHGPFLPGGKFYSGEEAGRDAHQAWHALVASVMPWQRMVLLTTAATDRATRAATALALPRRKP